jgi:hypothetical protein
MSLSKPMEHLAHHNFPYPCGKFPREEHTPSFNEPRYANVDKQYLPDTYSLAGMYYIDYVQKPTMDG